MSEIIKRCQFQGCSNPISLEEGSEKFQLGLLEFCSANCQTKQLSHSRKIQKHIDSIKETIEGCNEALLNRRRELCLLFCKGEHRYNFFEEGFFVVDCEILSVNDLSGLAHIKYIHPKTNTVVVEPVFPEKLMWGKGERLNG